MDKLMKVKQGICVIKNEVGQQDGPVGKGTFCQAWQPKSSL